MQDNLAEVADMAVVGAGAAGLMTAISARTQGLSVLLLDGREKIGAKILMSGGTRCNVTNEKVSERDFQSMQIRQVRNVLRAFPAPKAVEFFQKLGVELVLEPGGKYFPATHSGRTVLEALTREAARIGVNLVTGFKVESVQREGSVFNVKAQAGAVCQAKTVVLCTGGLSFPTSGSDGSGYALAQAFGHSLIPTSPSLTPLLTADADWKSLSGVTLPVRLTLYAGKEKNVEYEGSFLFTHTGYSGPVVLNISRHWIRLNDASAVLTANFLPALHEDDLRKALAGALSENPKMMVKNFLALELPEKLAVMLIKKAGLPENRIMNQVSREEREALVKGILRASLSVSGSAGYAKAEVTAGGVDLTEVDDATMESRLQPGLFFAGEILDVDGRIGGFNFQWAWSSGVTAAAGAARRVKNT